MKNNRRGKNDLFDFKRLSEDLHNKLVEAGGDESMRKMCRDTGIDITFLVRLIHYDVYRVKNCTILNLLTVISAFNLKCDDYVNYTKNMKKDISKS